MVRAMSAVALAPACSTANRTGSRPGRDHGAVTGGGEQRRNVAHAPAGVRERYLAHHAQKHVIAVADESSSQPRNWEPMTAATRLS